MGLPADFFTPGSVLHRIKQQKNEGQFRSAQKGAILHGETWRGRDVHSYDLVIEMSQAGEVNHEGLITHRFPFEEYKQAIATAMDKRRSSIKVALEY